ncbi:sugar ABC transporter permease [Treponema phagedenis]|uniref:ABC transporter, permease protein n=1 Tax=Treponema phagedenis TaxID=162 RepID=A0A0B7H004_TREPH|nr:sugar ABC transporter permease [Treponema phagedenis]EFW36608.1 ABC transporter, permease protein [Treponema phagedenis F0421]NVP23641.1 sugar ABC transporter permease [Treponema phagedenis]QEJ94526.1 sugar ABC transporter permease [Treponema phagedenis]QEJ98767.1 sugar ABC transporter permease [Treponema phagedenis]QEK01594.1 sugar ABC transporter permease [Treponema phagedenis]
MSRLQRLKKAVQEHKTLYAMMFPFLFFFLLFTIIPIVISVYFSFTQFNVLQPPKFIGVDNYTKLFLSDPIFLKAVKNTFIMALIIGPFGYIFSFLMAWLINELPRGLRTVFTVIFYAPSISGNAYMIFLLIFSGDAYGYLNAKLLSWGILKEPMLWLQNEKYMMSIVILVSLWMSLGVGFLSFIAGLQGVDRSQYEAAEIDGVRNRWQELWFITLPNMKPQLLFGAVMSVTGSLAVADVTVALTGFPSPNYATHTIINHLNDYGIIRLEMGYASAIAVLLFFLMLGLNNLVQKMLRKVGT